MLSVTQTLPAAALITRPFPCPSDTTKLDTVGSVNLDDQLVPGKEVKRGFNRLGNFYYGRSLIILSFSKGLATSV